MRTSTFYKFRLLIATVYILSGCGEVATVTQSNPLGSVQNVKLLQATLAPIVVDQPYKEIIPVEGGQPPLQFSLLGGTLPPGLKLAETSGIISGQVERREAKKSSSITVEVKDSLGLTSQQTYTLQVNEYSFTIVPEKLENVVPGIPFVLNLNALGASKPVKFATSGTLPPGLTLDESGLIKTGADGIAIEFQNSEWAFEAIATDANGVVINRKYELKLGEYLGRAPLTMETETLPTPTALAEYSTGVVTNGGVVPYIFSISAGELPPGLVLNAETGAISGIVSAAAASKPYNFSVRVVDAKKSRVTKSFSTVVDPYSFTIEPATLPTITPGVAFSMTFSAPGAEPAIQFSSSGSLPPGLTLGSNGTLSTGPDGIAEAHQNSSWSFTISATDKNGIIKNRVYALNLGPFLGSSALTLVNESFATPTARIAYSVSMAVAGGKQPYAFALASGALPPGLSLNLSSGTISGVVSASAAGKAYSFGIKVTDAKNTQVTKNFSTVVDPYSFTVEPTTLPTISPGIPFSMAFSVPGAEPPVQFSSSGTMPPGLTINSSGVLSTGVDGLTEAQQNTNWTFTISATDANGVVKSRNYTLSLGAFLGNAALAIVNNSIVTPTARSSYSGGITVSGGKSPYAFTVSSGELPPGLSLNSSTGGLSGTVSAAAASKPYNFVIKVLDSKGTEVTKNFSTVVDPYNFSVEPATLPTISPGVPFAMAFSVPGAEPSTVFSSSGSLPPGLTISSSGTLSTAADGIVEAHQNTTWNFTVSATDSNGITKSRAYVLSLGAFLGNAPLTIVNNSIATPLARTSYSGAIAVSGGKSPYAFSVASGALPPGISLNTSTGAFSGTVAAAAASKAYNFAIKVVDAKSTEVTKNFSTVVDPYSFTVEPATLPTISPGIPFSMDFSVPGAEPTTVFSSSGSLPPGMTINSSGTLSTGPEGLAEAHQNTTWAFTVSATDSNGIIKSRAYTLNLGAFLGNAALTIVTSNITTPTARASYAAGISISGGKSPYTFSVFSGALPPGLSLNSSTGAFSGTVTAAAAGKAYNFVIKVVDAKSTEVTKNFTTVVDPYNFTIEPATLPTIVPGVPFSMALSVPGAEPTTVFSSSGSLPPGLTISSSGTILTGANGIDEAHQNTTWNFTVSATDTNGITKSRAYTLALGAFLGNAPLTIVNDNIATPSAGNVYSSGIAVSGGKSPYVFATTSGTLPSGLSLDTATGLISGNVAFAAANTSYDFTIRVRDAALVEKTKRYQGTVSPGNALLTIHTTSMVNPLAGSGYSAVIAVSGGSVPYTYTLNSGTLPTGLSLGASTGIISGTVSFAAGGQNFSFEIKVTDSVGQSSTKSYSGTTQSGVSSLSITTTSLPTIYAGSAYASVISISGGKSPFTYVIESGGLVPTGLSLQSATGILSGNIATNMANQPYVFTVRVTDDIGQAQTRTYSSNVAPYVTNLIPTTFTAGDPEKSYSASLITVGGQSPYTYTITSGALPSGLSLNTTTGVISGTIEQAEAGQTRSLTISSSDANGITTNRSYSIVVAGFVVTLSTTSLPTAFEGSSYATTLTSTGGTGPYTYEYTGNLPTGIGMSNTGVFFGTPAVNQGTTSGTSYPIAIRAKDANGRVSVATALSISVSLTAPSIANATRPPATLGTLYTHTLSASGGRGPYTYSVDSGTLATGLSLSSSGVISGTPTVEASCPAQTIIARVTDSSTPTAQTATRPVCVSAVTGLIFTNPSLPTIVRAQAYSIAVQVAGGTGPYTISAASLPAGLSIASNGELTGSTIVAPGKYTAFISASDSSGLLSTIPFVLTVADPISMQSLTLPKGGHGKLYSTINLVAVGGIAPHIFSISSGSLPPGLSLSSAGVLSGTVDLNADVNTPYTFRIRISDSSGLSTETSNQQISISKSPVILPTRLETTVSGSNYRRALDFSGGVPPLTFSATGFPPGITIDPSSGLIMGSTLSTGDFTPAITIVDSNGISTSTSIPFRVNSAGKTLNFFSQKFSDPCPQTVSWNCSLMGQQLGKLVNSQPTTNYLVYGANLSAGTLTAPVPRIYIARVDGRGRIETPGTSALNVSLTPVGFITAIEIADIDLDGHQDIIAGVYGNLASISSRLAVYWNTGTTDASGMPQFTAPTEFGTSSFTNRISSIKAVKMRNGSFANTTDILVGDWRYDVPNNSARIVAFMGTCTSNCSGSRATALPASPATAYSTTLANTRTLMYMTAIDAGRFTDTECKSIVVAGTQDNSGSESYLLIRRQDKSAGACSGTFSTTTQHYLGNGTWRSGGLAVANFNNDGYDDVAVVSQNASNVRVVLMDPAGAGFGGASTFFDPTLLNVGAEIVPYCLDGSLTCSYPSLAVFGGRKLNYTSTQGQGGNGFISFLPNTNGTFENGTGAERLDYAAPIGIGQDLIVAPIVSSNKNDIMVMGSDQNGLPFLLTYENNAGSTTFPLKQQYQIRSLPADFGAVADVGPAAVADLNRDGHPDLISYLVNQQAIAVHQGPLGVNYGISPEFYSAGVQHGSLTPWHQQHAMAVRDIDSDHDIDIVLVGAASRSIAVMLGEDQGQIASPVLYAPAPGDQRPYGIALGDVNADGKTDIVSTSDNFTATEPVISILHGVGDGTFLPASIVAIGSGTAIGNVGCTNPRNVILNDLDLDGKPEIILGCYDSARIVIFRRHTDGSWKKNNGTINTGGTNGTAIAVGHLTPGDSCYSVGADFVGRPCVDLVMTQYVANATVRVIENLTMGAPTGSGTFNVNFTSTNIQNFFGYGHDVSIADFDQDGLSDYVVSMPTQNSSTNQSGQIFKVCRSNGIGGCIAVEGGGMDLQQIQGVTAADFDNDGLTDLISTSRMGTRLPFLMISRHRNISQ